MSCPIKVDSNTIEFTMHTSCYLVLDLLCVNNSANHFNVSTVSGKCSPCSPFSNGYPLMSAFQYHHHPGDGPPPPPHHSLPPPPPHTVSASFN